MKEVKDLGEFNLINLLSSELNKFSLDSVIGIGDDCAVLPLDYFSNNSDQAKIVITTDTLVENIHFKWNFTTAKDLGWKILAVSMSDIAAMGGLPKAAFINLKIQKNFPLDILQEIYRGMNDLMNESQIDLLGGDTVSAEENSFSLTLLGVCQGLPVLRSGAKAGDSIWVTGEIGNAFCGLHCLSEEITSIDNLQKYLQAYNKPEPRVKIANEIGKRNLASSMIDISDGMLQDLQHLATKSKATMKISEENIPVAQGYKDLNMERANLLVGGDDYELLFTAPCESTAEIELLKDKYQVNLSKIGEVIHNEKAQLQIESSSCLETVEDYLNKHGIKNLGYNHFSHD